ncbi:MAG: hypothetical protein AAFN41_13485, partial [Planctomycetota bacterium]
SQADGTFDRQLGGLHEWFSGGDGRGSSDGLAWYPPLCVLIDLAWRVARCGSHVCWVGRACWPSAQSLVRRGAEGTDSEGGDGDTLLRRSLYVDAADRAEVVWAAELAARSGAVGLVVADGRGLGMAESRRLHLAAGQSGCAVMAARRGDEVGALSAAGTRWRVGPWADGEASRGQAWMVELLRDKSGVGSGLGLELGLGTDAVGSTQGVHRSARRWVVRRDHATGTISEWIAWDGERESAGDGGVAASVVGGSASASGEARAGSFGRASRAG